MTQEAAMQEVEDGGQGGSPGEQEGDAPSLEGRIRRLEEILTTLEADDLELERALALFEEGVGHVRAAERTLSETELRVEELLSDGETTRPFAGEAE